MNKPLHLDLFTGIGGFILAAQRAGFQTVQAVAIEPFCQAVLKQNFPGLSIYGDIQDYDATYLRGTISLLTGGFPCQDVSFAGKGAGIEGKRSGLWTEMYRVICECRPAFCLIENVPALRNRGADRVLSDLEGAGYSARAFVVGADNIGATHRRKRVWIVAYDRAGLASAKPAGLPSMPASAGEDYTGQQDRRTTPISASGRNVAYSTTGQGNERRPGDVDTSPGGGESADAAACPECHILADTNGAGRGEHSGEQSGREELPSSQHGGATMAYTDELDGRRELQQSGVREQRTWVEREGNGDGLPPFPPARNNFRCWAAVAEVDASFMPCVEREVRRVASRLSYQVDGIEIRGSLRNNRLKALGNAIVPDVAEIFCRWIREQLQ